MTDTNWCFSTYNCKVSTGMGFGPICDKLVIGACVPPQTTLRPGRALPLPLRLIIVHVHPCGQLQVKSTLPSKIKVIQKKSHRLRFTIALLGHVRDLSNMPVGSRSHSCGKQSPGCVPPGYMHTTDLYYIARPTTSYTPLPEATKW